MTDAVIVSTARTPIGKAYRGSLNNTHGAELAGHAIAHAVQRAGIDGAEVEDVLMGCGLPEGATGGNIGRQAALMAGLPVTTSGVTINRFCSSGLQAISMAAQRIIVDGVPVAVAGGLDSISLVQNAHMNKFRAHSEALKAKHEGIYLSMIETAEIVAKRYGISREQMDDYALQSQQRTAAAQQNGIYDNEIVPMDVVHAQYDKATDSTEMVNTTISKDECNRPGTTLEGLAGLKPVIDGGVITAGNASQLSDGASASVLMSDKQAVQRNLPVLGTYRGMVVTGCEPDEMGIGPVFAVPRLLQRHGLTVNDIGLWELNEAFAVQVLYCRDRLGIDNDKLNVNGGAISVGHPYGMSGARMVGHVLLEAQRRKARYAVTTMCIGGGMGMAALFEVNC
ncbi:acetyl-CoA C-acyltransferase [Alteromonas gilva]|uniref:acetyl-CoA C-acyltransferase n=1 Tax=Alteromonas gilva TaxID=2987522 RepID=A0ABT5L2T5_9ALTE|nr:acetyl-CoA C-acyltransferase [Alteromonas gilva]MDC8830152.1 acetyl-CoA C-acyltransferase [Alteromonas gilva]